MYELNEDNCRELACAIIGQAAEDYVNATRALAKSNISEKRRRANTRLRDDCLDFFESNWFIRLSRGMIEPEAMVDALNKKAYDRSIKVVKFF